jgi:hypothetical protein
MDPRHQAQAYIHSPQRGPPHQSFAHMGFESHGASANMPSPTAQPVGWYGQGNATNNLDATIPATYPRQPATNTTFGSPSQNPKSPVTQES